MTLVIDSKNLFNIISALVKKEELTTDLIELSDIIAGAGKKNDKEIILITECKDGVQVYHKNFIKNCIDTDASLKIILLNDNTAACDQFFLHISSIKTNYEKVTLSPSDTESLIHHLKGGVMRFDNRKILLYSRFPVRGKKTVKEIFEKHLLKDYEIVIIEPFEPSEIPEELQLQQAIKKEKASIVIILAENPGEKVDVPEGIKSYTLLTFADKNPYEFLDEWIFDLEECLKRNIFRASPLYELWRLEGLVPRMDDRLLVFNNFCLPVIKSRMSDDEISDFLNNFTAVEWLSKKIKE